MRQASYGYHRAATLHSFTQPISMTSIKKGVCHPNIESTYLADSRVISPPKSTCYLRPFSQLAYWLSAAMVRTTTNEVASAQSEYLHAPFYIKLHSHLRLSPQDNIYFQEQAESLRKLTFSIPALNV